MKLKGLSKIAIAGAALAATAATLGTSTYAWYVSNVEATATGVVAQMQDSTGGSIYISKNGTKFQSEVAYDMTTDFVANNTPGNVTAEFFPITTADGLAFTNDEGTAETGKKLVFTTWLKSDSAVTVAPHLSVTNTTANPASKAQTLYADVNADHGAGSTMTVDVVEALRMAVVVDDAQTATIYDVKAIADSYTTPTGFVGSTGLQVSRSDNLGAAHGYYFDVTGEAPHTTAAASAGTSWGNISLTANTAKKLKFIFWLEGADDECFDSCAGQTVSFAFNYTLVANS